MFIMIGALFAPALIVFVLKLATSPVAVCTVESPLCHAIVWPTFIVAGFGAYDWAPRSPLMETVTSADDVVGDAGLDDEEPHAAAETMRVVSERRIRIRVIQSIGASGMPRRRLRFTPHFTLAERR